MGEQSFEWSVRLYREYLEVRKKFLEEKNESSYEKFCILSNYFLPIDNKAMMFNAYDKLESRIKELEAENTKLLDMIHYALDVGASGTGWREYVLKTLEEET